MPRTWADIRAERERQTGQRLEDNTAYRKAALALALGDAIRSARRRAGLTQQELAARMGTSQSQVARLETGRTNAEFETLARIARVTDTSFVITPAGAVEVGVGVGHTVTALQPEGGDPPSLVAPSARDGHDRDPVRLRRA